MKISIVIPVYNASETIFQCLKALVTQDYPKEDYEIIVVNDGSTDNTANIVRRYPVRLINLEKNFGRIIARETGARAASYDLLVFIDSRCIASQDLLRKIRDINYQPLMAGDHGEDKYRSNFDRLFFLIRRRLYWPYYPQTCFGKELYIDNDNFNRAPKGTTMLVINKDLLLQSLPADKGKSVNDDTRILRKVVSQRKILRHSDLKITYLQRTHCLEVIKHLFERGPRFADYYLVKGGPLYRKYQLGLLILAVLVGVGILFPTLFLYYIIALFLGHIILSLYLAENLPDFPGTLVYSPVVAAPFILGIIKYQGIGLVNQVISVMQGITNYLLRCRKYAGIIILILLIAFFGVYFKTHWVEFNPLRTIKKVYLFPLLLLSFALLFSNGLLTKAILAEFRVRLKFKEYFGLSIITSMGNYLVTAVGGPAARALYLKKRYQFPYATFLATLGASYNLLLAVAGTLGGSIAMVLYLGQGDLPLELLVFSLLLTGLAIPALWLVPYLPKISPSFGRLLEGWEVITRSKSLMGKLSGLFFINFFLISLQIFYGYRAFSFPIDFLPAIIIGIISGLTWIINLTPANLGVQEGIIGLVSTAMGSGFQKGVLVALLVRISNLAIIFTLAPLFTGLLLRRESRGRV